MKYYTLLITLLILIYSCVPQRKFTEEQARNTRLKNELQTAKTKLARYLEENGQLSDRMVDMEKELRELLERTELAESGFSRLKQQNTDLNELYDKLINQNKDLLSTSSAQNQRLKLELDSKKRELETKEANLTEKQTSIEVLREDLELRERRVSELQNLLSQKESAVKELRDKLTQALLGFDEEELSVEIRNGKVYVSLAEKLLFKSGSTSVDPKGQEALKKLAEVLKKKPDINILIEGHTDNDPIKSASISDNWDLSVLRATSIVRILSKNKIDPKRIMAAGRGEHFPVDSNETTVGKRKNRRTEIILTPKLDEIFKLLEDN